MKVEQHRDIDSSTQTGGRDAAAAEERRGEPVDKPEDLSLFSPAYRISDGGRETPPCHPAILLKMNDIF